MDLTILSWYMDLTMSFWFVHWTIHITIETITYWAMTGLALIGVELNIRHDKRCFMIWSITNAFFAIETYLLGGWNMTFLFCIYFIQAIRGLRWWKNDNLTNRSE